MTLVASGLISPLKSIMFNTNSFTGFQGRVIDAAGEKLSFVFRIPKTGNVDTLRLRVGAVTVSETLKVGLYTVDGDGVPTTTPYNGTGTETFTPSASAENVITASPVWAVVEGDLVALTIEFDSAVGNVTLQDVNQGVLGFPYTYHNGVKTAAAPLMALGYDDGDYPYMDGVCPFTSQYTTASTSNASTPDEIATKIQFPFPVRLRGMLICLARVAAADFEIINYDGVTAVSGMTLAVDGDLFQSAAFRWYSFLWNTPEQVAANEARYLAFRPTTATGITRILATVGAAAAMETFMGPYMQGATRVDQGAWTDTPTSFYYILPIFDQLSALAHGSRLNILPGS